MKKQRLNIHFEEIEDFIHPELTKVKVWIATYGKNVNNSNITKTAFENALESLKNIPIVGEWNESIEDFKGHGGKIEITSEGIEWIQTTKSYGVIPESCNPRWENDESGKEYLVCDGILWTSRYEESKKVLENTCNQSMEITPIDVEEENGVININSFNFSAICILGENTKPCFPSSKIVYSLDKDAFKMEFSLLLDKIKTLEKQEGGNSVDKELLLKKFAHLKGVEFEALIANEDLSLEDLEKQLFALSVNDLENRVREQLATITYQHTDYWGDSYERRKYYFTDLIPEENIVIVEDNEKYYVHMGIPYEMNGDELTLKTDEAVRYIRGDWRKFEGSVEPEVNPIFNFIENKEKEKIETITKEFEETKSNLETITADFEQLKSDKAVVENELIELKQFKANYEKAKLESEIQTVIDKYSELEKIEGYEKIIETKYECSIEDLESKLKLFAYDNGIIIGKKTQKKPSQKETVKFSLTPNIKNENSWAFLEQYT